MRADLTSVRERLELASDLELPAILATGPRQVVMTGRGPKSKSKPPPRADDGAAIRLVGRVSTAEDRACCLCRSSIAGRPSDQHERKANGGNRSAVWSGAELQLAAMLLYD